MTTADLIELHEHLLRPDGPDLHGRGHHVTQAGDPRRRQTVYLPLLTRWAQYRFVDKDIAPHIGKAKVAKGFRLVIADRRRRASMADMKLALSPFTVPNYVIGIMPPRQKQDGFTEGPKWALSDLEPDVLAQLCDDFRAAVFAKAGKPDPAVK